MQFELHVVQGNTPGEIENGPQRPIRVPGSADAVQDDTRGVPNAVKVCRLSLLLCQATLYSIL